MPLGTIVATLLLLILPATAHAALGELLGKYATTDDGCESGTTPEFEIRRGIVEGPNLLCIIGVPKGANGGALSRPLASYSPLATHDYR